MAETRERYLTVAGILRDEFKRQRKSGVPPRAGWMDAVRFLEDLSSGVATPTPEEP